MIYSKTELKKIRIDNGLTLKEFANTIAVSLSSVQKWEGGRRNPTKEMWFFIISKFNVKSTKEIILDSKNQESEKQVAFHSLKIEDKLNVIYERLDSLVKENNELRKKVKDNEDSLFITTRQQLEQSHAIQGAIQELQQSKKDVVKLNN